MKKHVLLAVAVVLLCVLMAGVVSADGTTTSVETFDALKTALANGGTVVLANDITGDYSTSVAIKSVETTLDLNGKMLSLGCTAGKNTGFIIVNGTSTTQGKLTVKNGTITLTQQHASYKWATIFFASEYGTVVIEDGTYSAPAFVVGGNGDGTHTPPIIEIKGGKLTSTNDAVVFLSAKNTKFDMTGGEISGLNGIEIVSGTVNIKGGTVTATSEYEKDISAPSSGSIGMGGTAILLRTTNGYDGNIALTISDDAKITSTKGVAIRSFIHTADLKNTDQSAKTASVTISGGTIEGEIASFRCDHYTSDVQELANPFTQITGGTFIVHTFDDLKACLEAGTDVKIGEDITVSDSSKFPIKIGAGKTSVLDLNGHKIMATGSETTEGDPDTTNLIGLGWKEATPAKLTITDSGTGGKITVSDMWYMITVGGKSELILDGGDYHAEYAFMVSGTGTYDTSKNQYNREIKITIKGDSSISNEKDVLIYLPCPDGTLTITENAVLTSYASCIDMCSGTLTVSGNAKLSSTGPENAADVPNSNGSLEDGSTIVVERGTGYGGNIAVNIQETATISSAKGSALSNYIVQTNLNNGETVTFTISGSAKLSGQDAALANKNYKGKTETQVGTFNLNGGYYKFISADGSILKDVTPKYAENHAMSDTPVKDGYYAPITVQKQETPATCDETTKVVSVSDGTAVPSTTNPNEVTVIPTGSDKVILTLTYEKAPTVSTDGKTVTPQDPADLSNVKAVYNEITVPDTSGAVQAKLTLAVTSGTELLDSDNLPTISTEINEDAKTKLEETATLISMVTVDITKIKSKNPVLTLTFKVPKSWFAGKDLSAVRAYHFDGTKIEEIGVPQITEDGTDYVFTITATEASPWGLGLKSPGPAPGPQPQPVYSSGDGNMENAFRVLFETSGGSFISPSTGLSYGDKISQPPAPTKDGYTFGGWYTDSACTQSWSFASGINGDMTLYAKWTKASGSTTTTTAKPTVTATTKPTSAPVSTQSQNGAATTAAPVTTTAAGVTPVLTQASAPAAGLLFGLLAAGILIRRRD